MRKRPGPAALEENAAELARLASPCRLCPRRCGAERRAGKTGFCRAPFGPVVSSCHPHHGEEIPLSGRRGSGTIFFTWCNLGCVFCQNHDISQEGKGTGVTVAELAGMMLRLQDAGCHNLNLVSPTHQAHSIAAAIVLAREQGLALPVVYNTGGYDAVETLALLEGMVDIYMPDVKFSDPVVSRRLADAPDYPEAVKAAVREMHRQVGDLVIGPGGIARRGLLVRHLVLPHDLAGSDEVFRFLAEEISPHTYLNVMSQYLPCGKALGAPLIGDPITREEYLAAAALARRHGLSRLD